MRSSTWAGPAITTAGALAVWEAAGRCGLYPPHLFPPPSRVAVALADMARSGQLRLDAAASARRWLLGLLLGNAFGVAMGVLTGYARWARRSVGHIMHFLRTIPFLALVPLGMLWFGLGESEKVAITAWGAAFPVWLSVQTGILGVEPEYVWAAQCLGARGARLLWEVYFKSCLAFLAAGARVSIATATFALVAAEMSGAFQGLGFRVFYDYQMFQTERMMAGIAVIACAGLALDRAFIATMQAMLPWLRQANESL